jgi:hypothetical protein
MTSWYRSTEWAAIPQADDQQQQSRKNNNVNYNKILIRLREHLECDETKESGNQNSNYAISDCIKSFDFHIIG